MMPFPQNIYIDGEIPLTVYRKQSQQSNHNQQNQPQTSNSTTSNSSRSSTPASSSPSATPKNPSHTPLGPSGTTIIDAWYHGQDLSNTTNIVTGHEEGMWEEFKEDASSFLHRVWNTGVGYQVRKFLGYTEPEDPWKKAQEYSTYTITIPGDALSAIEELGSPATSIGYEDQSNHKPEDISMSIRVPSAKLLAKKAAGSFVQGAFGAIDLPIVALHSVVDKKYREQVVQGIKNIPNEFEHDPIGSSVETLGSIVGGSVGFHAADTALARIKGRIRTRGLPEVKPEDIIEKRVIAGEKVFSEYPDEFLRASPEAKASYLNKANQRVKAAIESKAGVQSTGEYLGLHATDIEFPKVTKVLEGSSESPGLYIAPEGSPYFLRLGVPARNVPRSNSFNIKDLFKPKFMRDPTFVAVQTEKVSVFPKTIKNLKQFNRYVESNAGSGKNIITFKSALGGKPEMESIIPPGTILEKVPNGVRVEWMGVKVPVRIYKAIPVADDVSNAASNAMNIAKRLIKTAKGIKPSSSSSLGLETTPWGSYSLGAAVNFAVSKGAINSRQNTVSKPTSGKPENKSGYIPSAEMYIYKVPGTNIYSDIDFSQFSQSSLISTGRSGTSKSGRGSGTSGGSESGGGSGGSGRGENDTPWDYPWHNPSDGGGNSDEPGMDPFDPGPGPPELPEYDPEDGNDNGDGGDGEDGGDDGNGGGSGGSGSHNPLPSEVSRGHATLLPIPVRKRRKPNKEIRVGYLGSALWNTRHRKNKNKIFDFSLPQPKNPFAPKARTRREAAKPRTRAKAKRAKRRGR